MPSWFPQVPRAPFRNPFPDLGWKASRLRAAGLILLALSCGRVVFGQRLALSSSFSGATDDGGGVPPDVQGAAGPDHLLVMLNTKFVAQRKSDGEVVRTWTPASFWAPVSGGDLLFDPRVAYDALAGRWLAVIATEGVTGPPAVLLAVSAGADPTGAWAFQKLPAGSDDYAEFPLVGYNGRWIVVTSNLISGSTGYLSGSAIWSIEKASLAAGGAPSVSRFTRKTPGSPIAPVVTLDADQPDELLLQQDTETVGHRRLRVFRVTDSAGQATLSSPVMASAPVTWNAMPAPLESLPQAGTTRRIISDQDEVSSACLRNGAIWAVQTAALPAAPSAPAHTVIQWWKLAPDARVLGFGRIEGPGGTWLGFPSIAVNGKDDVLIGYSLFSSGSYASAGYSARSGCDGEAALSEIHLLKSGEASYERVDGGGHNRWGDLSQTVVDPDNTRLWTLQEYAAAPDEGNSRWGTWWGGFTPAAGPRAGACVAPPSSASPAEVGARAGRQH